MSKKIEMQQERWLKRQAKTGQHGVPVIVINGKWNDAVIGFYEKSLRKMLGIK